MSKSHKVDLVIMTQRCSENPSQLLNSTRSYFFSYMVAFFKLHYSDKQPKNIA